MNNILINNFRISRVWHDLIRDINSQKKLQDFQLFLLKQEYENLVIPIKKSNNYIHAKDKKGFRIYDYQILSIEQTRKLMNMENCNASTIVAPICRDLNIGVNDLDSFHSTKKSVESYSKFLNVTYAVDEDTLMNFYHGYEYEENNLAKKTVKDCSVHELLFAINKKLNK